MAVNLGRNVGVVGVPHHVPDLVLFRRRGDRQGQGQSGGKCCTQNLSLHLSFLHFHQFRPVDSLFYKCIIAQPCPAVPGIS